MQRIIDAHVHIYPDKIADKAVQAIGSYYGLPTRQNGRIAQLLESGKSAGITDFLVHSTATVPHQVASINGYIATEAANNPCLTGFGTLHPALSQQEIESEVCRMLSLGLKGVKLHPDFQGFAIDSKSAYGIYGALAEAGLPALFHVGDPRSSLSQPFRLAKVARDFPHLTVIGAHMGGYCDWRNVTETYKGLKNMRFDTSSTLFALSGEEAMRIIRTLGAENFLFGSDFPLWDPAEELRLFLTLPLTEREKEGILFTNAQNAIGIK